jgi:hypothetical protein
MKYFRIIFFITLGFILGYFSKDYLDLYHINTKNIVETATGLKSEKPAKKNSLEAALVVYKNGQFEPQKVSVHLGNRITIRNDGDALMWLVSDYNKLNTTRGYTLKEQLVVKTDKAGEFTLTNKLNLNSKAVISVVN